MASGVLLLVGGLFIGAVVIHWVTTHFVIWGSRVVTESGIRNYEVRNRPLAWVTGTFLVVGLAAALIFAIPQGRGKRIRSPSRCRRTANRATAGATTALAAK